MGINWKSGHSPENLKAHFNARGAGGKAALEEILTHVAEDGAEDIRRTIMTTPSALSPGKENRYWKGDMYRDVNSKPVTSSGSTVKARWGWTDNIEDYYIDQEKGSSYVQPPMHAVYQSFIARREEFKTLIQKLVGR